MNLRKLLFIPLVLLFTIYFDLSHAEEEYCSPYDNNCTNDYSEEPIDCDKCCAQGRFASEECLRRCNGCLMRNDQATSEYNDWPF